MCRQSVRIDGMDNLVAIPLALLATSIIYI